MATHEAQACSLQLYTSDKLRFVNFPLDLQVDIRDMIPNFWTKGIQNESTHESSGVKCFELKVRGNPWSDFSNWKTAGVSEASHFLLGIIRFMHDQGWRVAHSMATMAMADHDAIFFERLKQIPAKRSHMCCLAFGLKDTLRITDGSPEVIEAIEQTILQHWQKGLSEQSFHESESTHDFKLGGSPFGSMWINNRYVVDSFVMQLMSRLKDAGWSVYAMVGLRWVAAGAGTRSQVINRWILKKDD